MKHGYVGEEFIGTSWSSVQKLIDERIGDAGPLPGLDANASTMRQLTLYDFLSKWPLFQGRLRAVALWFLQDRRLFGRRAALAAVAPALPTGRHRERQPHRCKPRPEGVQEWFPVLRPLRAD